VKLTVQKEAFVSTIVQQIFQVEYLVQHTQCPDCTRLAAKDTWKAVVQVRQKVPHKRTFLYLEQLILKNGVQKDTISVKEVKDGLDFFYSQRNHAIRMTEFLANVAPVRTKGSERLISKDTHTNVANYKFTYSSEIAPICKDDLVCMPIKQARLLGNINPLTVCTRVGNVLHLMDPATLQTCEVQGPIYWRAPFDSLANVQDMVEFTVLDIEPQYNMRKGKFLLADAQVALSSAFRSQTGKGGDDMAMEFEGAAAKSSIYHTRTHLGALLQPGDTVMGYHLSHRNFNSDHFASLPQDRIPDVVLVKKSYPNRKKHKNRNWRLKSMAMEAEETGDGKGVVGRLGGRDKRKVEEDYELFLRDLEEDVEMRQTINLYKAGGAKKKGGQYGMDVDEAPAPPANGEDNMDGDTGEDEGDGEEMGPTLDELLDDMHLSDGEEEPQPE